MEQTTYPVSEAANILGEKSSALRYWEEQFGLDIRRNSKGNRCYRTEDIQIFLCIQELKKKGYQLKKIKELIPLLKQAILPVESENRQLRFYEILERLMQELKQQKYQEDRYKRVDEAIRQHQIARKQVAVTEERKRQKGREKKKRRERPAIIKK